MQEEIVRLTHRRVEDAVESTRCIWEMHDGGAVADRFCKGVAE